MKDNQGKLKEIIEIVESKEFRFTANQAAGIQMFRHIIRRQEAFRQLQIYVSSTDGALEVLKRISVLVSLDFDTRYEHPQDTALATYLMALDSQELRFAQSAANMVCVTTQLWWAAKIAKEILTRPKRESRTLDIQQIVTMLSTGWPGIGRQTDARDIYRCPNIRGFSLERAPFVGFGRWSITAATEDTASCVDIPEGEMGWIFPPGAEEIASLTV